MSTIHNIQELTEKHSLQQAQGTIIFHNNEYFKYWDEGCSRYVYVNEDRTKVIKIEKFQYGSFNKEEAEVWNKASEENRELMVEAKLIGNIIEQEFVLPIKFGGKRLNIEQRLFASSCRNEVGWTKDGKLKCFDLDEFKRY